MKISKKRLMNEAEEVLIFGMNRFESESVVHFRKGAEEGSSTEG